MFDWHYYIGSMINLSKLKQYTHTVRILHRTIYDNDNVDLAMSKSNGGWPYAVLLFRILTDSFTAKMHSFFLVFMRSSAEAYIMACIKCGVDISE